MKFAEKENGTEDNANLIARHWRGRGEDGGSECWRARKMREGKQKEGSCPRREKGMDRERVRKCAEKKPLRCRHSSYLLLV